MRDFTTEELIILIKTADDQPSMLDELESRDDVTRATRYAVTWQLPAAHWMRAEAHGLPAEAGLRTIRGYCAAYQISARLTDEAGFVKGFVAADGTYQLT